MRAVRKNPNPNKCGRPSRCCAPHRPRFEYTFTAAAIEDGWSADHTAPRSRDLEEWFIDSRDPTSLSIFSWWLPRSLSTESPSLQRKNRRELTVDFERREMGGVVPGATTESRRIRRLHLLMFGLTSRKRSRVLGRFAAVSNLNYLAFQ